MAYETKHARIGPLVSPMTYRNPGVLARQALTVAEISGGRLELGIGSGALDLRPRGHRRCRSGRRRSVRPRSSPGRSACVEMLAFERYHPKHDIRLTIAGRGPTILGLAARYAYRWNTFGGFGVAVEEAFRSRAARTTCGWTSSAPRPGRTVIRSVLLGYHGFIPETPWRSDEAFADVVERWREAGFDEAVFYYPPDTNMPEGTVTPGVFERALRRGSRPPSKSRAWRARSVPARSARRRPSRVKKRTTRGRPRAAHHHPELIGLGLLAFGLFMGTVLYVGLERRLRREGDRRRAGRASSAGSPTSLPIACIVDRRADGRAQRPAALRPVPHRAGRHDVRLALVLGTRTRRLPRRRGSKSLFGSLIGTTGTRILGVFLLARRRAARQRRLRRRDPAPLGPRRAQRAPGGRPAAPPQPRAGRRRSRSPRRSFRRRLRRRSTASRSSRTSSRRRRSSSSTRTSRAGARGRRPDLALRRHRDRRRGHRLHAARPGRPAPLEGGPERHRRAERPRRRGARPGARELRRRRDRRRRDRRPARHALRAPARTGDEGVEGRRR